MNLIILFVVSLEIYASNSQKVAPGVPPQHYQQQYQQPPPPQQQQYAQQYQQVPQQQVPMHQQVPVQQQQVPVQQQQQVPVQQQDHGHGHGHEHGQRVLSGNVQQEAQHIKEHMDVPIDTSKMSDQELQFHYFKMHDADNNNKLDGCELIKSLIHWHDGGENAKSLTDENIQEMVDSTLNSLDKDNDGYITYSEYKSYAVAD